MSKLSRHIEDRIIERDDPIISNPWLYERIAEAYQTRAVAYLRGNFPTRAGFESTRNALRARKILARDIDYLGLLRVLPLSDGRPDEIACLADPFAYVAHASAMELYQLTDRRQTNLMLTTLTPRLARERLKDNFQSAMSAFPDEYLAGAPRVVAHAHPSSVRGRPLDVAQTSALGATTPLRGTHARIATIGQTFLDTLTEPRRCGYMEHVLDVWAAHASKYLQEIINAVDQAPSAILKVRAGYILQERLGIADPRIDAWRAYAQRGGSRRLDPEAPYVERHSPKWMLSINAG